MGQDASFATEVQQPSARALGRRFLRDQPGWEREIELGHVHYTNFPKFTRPRAARSGFQRSPIFATRDGTLRIVKSSMRTPRSTSRHVTGAETLASGLGRTE